MKKCISRWYKEIFFEKLNLCKRLRHGRTNNSWTLMSLPVVYDTTLTKYCDFDFIPENLHDLDVITGILGVDFRELQLYEGHVF